MATRRRRRRRAGKTRYCILSGKRKVSCHRTKRLASKRAKSMRRAGRKARVRKYKC